LSLLICVLRCALTNSQSEFAAASGGVRDTLESTGNAKPRTKKEANGVEAFAYSTRETCSTGLAWPTAFTPLSFLLSVALSVSRIVLLQLESDSRKRTRTARYVNESKGLGRDLKPRTHAVLRTRGTSVL